MKYDHAEAIVQRWQTFSLMEQLANIGSEVGRARNWQEKNQDYFQAAGDRALELFDLTLSDPRWYGKLREIARAREIFCDALSGGKEYKTSLKELDDYFLQFAQAIRK